MGNQYSSSDKNFEEYGQDVSYSEADIKKRITDVFLRNNVDTKNDITESAIEPLNLSEYSPVAEKRYTQYDPSNFLTQDGGKRSDLTLDELDRIRNIFTKGKIDMSQMSELSQDIPSLETEGFIPNAPQQTGGDARDSEEFSIKDLLASPTTSSSSFKLQDGGDLSSETSSADGNIFEEMDGGNRSEEFEGATISETSENDIQYEVTTDALSETSKTTDVQPFYSSENLEFSFDLPHDSFTRRFD
jgi:hypothetical protein